MLTEGEIEDIIEQQRWYLLKRDGFVAPEKLKGNAAHAIHAWLREGVVWEAECEAYPTTSGRSIGLDFVSTVEQVGTVYLPRFGSEITKRQPVHVTVTTCSGQGEQASSTEQATAENALQPESKVLEADREEGDA